MSADIDPGRRNELFPEDITHRQRNPGAEKWVGEVIPVLDHGFVYLVDYMGDDQAIEDAARVSYGRGTRKVSQTRGLIRYLMRHRHTTPFEMPEMKFHAKMPLFVAAQWVRHRTANINQYSARYSILDKEFYIPEPAVIAEQSTTNRQGRGEAVDEVSAQDVMKILRETAETTYDAYDYLLNDDGEGQVVDPGRPQVARELARTPLSQSIYTQWYWKIDIHNLLHFLSLRMDEHAQWEIRQYANAIGQVVADSFPFTWEAFEDYHLNSKFLSGPEIEIISSLAKRKGFSLSEGELLSEADKLGLTNKRERKEFIAKLQEMGLLEEEDRK